MEENLKATSLQERFVSVDRPRVSTDPIPLNPRFFRPGSTAYSKPVNFHITDGGIGDYICYMSALVWIAQTHPHVEGFVYCGEIFKELAENILAPFMPRWKIYERSALTESKARKRPTYGPLVRPINCCGAHPVDLGFMYYANINPPPPEANFYPKLNLHALKSLSCEKPYVVMTPGAAHSNRQMAAAAFNGIKDHLISQDIVPVFLGKKQMTAKRKINFHDGYNYDGGLDLREQTSLLEAAAIMSKAQAVIGLDNGLLHLAACTEVPIVFGYTIASPEHRQPRRRKGLLRQIYPDPKQLTCTFCQSQMRLMFDHEFSKCMYKDDLCIDALSDPKDWIGLLDEILAESNEKPTQA